MNIRSVISNIFLQEDINFLLTNRIPRHIATRFMGWFSRIEHPLISRPALHLWRRMTDLRLQEARKSTFSSVHDCFVRELKPGARPVNPDPRLLTSPCDAIVGSCGPISGVRVIQAKGFPYSLHELLCSDRLVDTYRDGCYATLRITSSMYHRFHAPADCNISRVTYISGDTWNVNPIALKRVEKLFCRNERAVIETRIAANGDPVTLVPVAAILVAGIRLHFIDTLLHVDYRGPQVLRCDADAGKGEELGWFEHGSTIIVFAPRGYTMCSWLTEGSTIRVGEPLMSLPGN